MGSVNLKGKTYSFVHAYREDQRLRDAFNQLTRDVYGFDFVDWYKNGFWAETYIPYSLMDGDVMVANISVTEMKFLIGKEERTFLQIGTVMTAPEQRNKGLNRLLLEKVLDIWRGKTDLIYLFANQSVLEFYPKFGFKPVQEYQHSIRVEASTVPSTLTKLDMTDSKQINFVYEKVKSSLGIGEHSMLNNPGLVMFYCTLFLKETVYFLVQQDAVVVMEHDGDTLNLLDVFADKSIELTELLPLLCQSNTKQVNLHFTPRSMDSFKLAPLSPDDVLFVLDDKFDMCSQQKFMFPVLSHG